MSLPEVKRVTSLSFEEKSAALGLLFEPCKTLVDFVMPVLDDARKESNWVQLIESIRSKLHTLDASDPRVSKIVAAHPRLGAKKVESTQSQAEQASLKASEAEAAELKKWNDKYEATFPGLRYVVFVAGRPRSVILLNMQQRIAENQYGAEVVRAFDAMCDIALDRQGKLANNRNGSDSSKI